MKLSCYALAPQPLTLRPAPTTRAWMDRINDNHAYRCLPATLKEAWQRFYFLGKMPDGSSPEQHLHKLRLDAPIDKRKSRS